MAPEVLGQCVSFLPTDGDPSIRHVAATNSALREAVLSLHGDAALRARARAVRRNYRARLCWAALTVLTSAWLTVRLFSAPAPVSEVSLVVGLCVPLWAMLVGNVLTGVLGVPLTTPGFPFAVLAGLATAVGPQPGDIAELLPVVLLVAGSEPALDELGLALVSRLAVVARIALYAWVILQPGSPGACCNCKCLGPLCPAGFAARSTLAVAVACALSPRWLGRLVLAGAAWRLG